MLRTNVAVLLLLATGACGPDTESGTDRGAPLPGADPPTDRAESGFERGPLTAVAPDTRVYECEDLRFVARVRPDTAVILLRGATLRLPRVDSVNAGSREYRDGARSFRTPGDGGNNGDARLVLPAGTHSACRTDRGSSIWRDETVEGLDFRAMGQEPGWYLEIDRGGTMLMVADYGERRVTVPRPEPIVDREARRVTYRAATDAHELEVGIRGTTCRDAMSGIPFPMTVVVHLDGHPYRGCGQPLP